MAERIVINTGPIVALARARVTAIMAKMPISFVAPLEVQREIQKGPPAGHEAIDTSWVRFTPPPDDGIPVVCIDERKGRRAALAVGLKVTGTLGLLPAPAES